MRLFPKHRDLSQPPDRVELVVRGSDLQLPEEEVHVRLDAFLGQFIHWRSRTSIQRLIREGFVLIDPSDPANPAGRGELTAELRPGKRLLHGSRVVVVIPEPQRIQRATSAASELTILYEDDQILAVDKPPILPVHPSGRHLSDTLIQRVHAAYDQRKLDREWRIKLCHRLDRETSGIVLMARDPVSHSAIMKQFERRDVDKEYHAIVRGVPEVDSGDINLPLGPASTSQVRIKMAAVTAGLEARTRWRVLERYTDCALVSCKPETGRQHQIRVHMDAIGHSLVGDKLYGVDEQVFLRASQGETTRADEVLLGLNRHALHNHHISIRNPKTGEMVAVRSPIPEDMRQFLAGRERID
ncbi:RluA family pseudouridine synthase [Engelhardtia mirabilis]|uniref:Pseudouridine synthase n=1 Tax=Engelhardtia mirabilis TaxID=2528011 RepID=A0A518BSD5_9BACT|nr:Ribosomal large subunit pseudouridine synthase C [Planctomycetes bacterium Pla133]QDV04207.1 Ribosomal large subunit pseudouridine synthase C [Planctomycetes bacterium Pla86]